MPPVIAMRLPSRPSGIIPVCLPFGRWTREATQRTATDPGRGHDAPSAPAATRPPRSTTSPATLGIRKQTILYWFPSKEALLEAVVDRCADEVTPPPRARARGGRGRLRAGRGDGAGRCSGSPPATRRCSGSCARSRGSARRRRPGCSTARAAHRPRRRPSSRPRWTPDACAATTRACCSWPPTRWSPGMATEVEVLRAFGEEPTLPSLLRRRDELLSLLRAALEP